MRRAYTVPLPGGRALQLADRTLVMGIVNVTPDSFADAGQLFDRQRAIEAALAMVAEGADLLDVGGESTRPGASDVPADEERARVIPVIDGIARHVQVPISVDTSKAEVAAAALDAGASIVNDVSALQFDPGMGPLVAERGAAVVLMHLRGRPRDMQQHAEYRSVVAEVATELAGRIAAAEQAGVRREAIVLDPGIGFAKRAGHSATLLARLDATPLTRLGRPWLVGPSRKSFLTAAIGELAPPERDWATAAAVTAAVLAGARIVRVHRVAEMVQVVRVADMIRAARAGATA